MQGRYERKATGFTRDLSRDNEIEVDIDAGPRELHPLPELAGAWIYVDTDGPRNGTYEITDVTAETDSRATLDVGQKTTVQKCQNPHNPQEGFEYTIADGDRFSIPVVVTWERG